MSAQEVSVIDYRQAKAADALLPEPSILSSSGWNQLHLEVFQQPKFEITEHQHTMHVLACGLPNLPNESAWSSRLASGDRWLEESGNKNGGVWAILRSSRRVFPTAVTGILLSNSWYWQ